MVEIEGVEVSIRVREKRVDEEMLEIIYYGLLWCFVEGGRKVRI